MRVEVAEEEMGASKHRIVIHIKIVTCEKKERG